MKIDELKRAKSKVPFEPFVIHTADGRDRLVEHPDAVAWDTETPRTVAYVGRGGAWEILEAALITSLSSRPASAPKRKGGRSR